MFNGNVIPTVKIMLCTRTNNCAITHLFDLDQFVDKTFFFSNRENSNKLEIIRLTMTHTATSMDFALSRYLTTFKVI